MTTLADILFALAVFITILAGTVFFRNISIYYIQ